MMAVRVRGVSKSFDGRPVLAGLDMDVAAGSLLAILGPSGSGKSTLLRLLCGFERPRAGTIHLGGELVSAPGVHVPPERRHIGYVSQEGALFPHLSVAENIVFGLPREQRRGSRRVAEMLDLVGLPAGYASRPPQHLSGGEQQRVALARALAPAPGIVLLDEPFSALDAALRNETRHVVLRALKTAGVSAVLVTHDQEEALSMGDNVAVLWQGRLAQSADPRDLYRMPGTCDLARFVGEAVVLAGVVSGGVVTCALGSLALAAPAPSGRARVMVRPEQIQLGLEDGASECVRARVERMAFLGADTRVCLVLMPGGEPIVARALGSLPLAPGSMVGVRVVGGVIAYPPG